MKKTILGIMMAFLLTGSNLLAADGDLVVNGNVGIGTNPGYKLDVVGRSRIQSGGGFNTAGLWFTNIANTADRAFVGMNSDDSLGLWGEGGAGWGLSMDVNNGRVGIGTTQPLGHLSVMADNSGGTDRATQFVIQGKTNQNFKLNLGFHTELSPPYAEMGLVEEGVGWHNFVLAKNGGNVGIGTTNPGTYKLYVAGVVNATGGYQQVSESKYKKDVLPIDSALSKVLSLQGVSFNWRVEEYKEKMGFTEGRRYGLIAEEVKTVLPEVVGEGPEGEGTVSYSEIVPLLIEAIKAQQQEIVKLRTDLEALKK